MQLVTPLRPSWPPISDPSSPSCGLAQKMLQGQGWLFKHLPYDSYAVRHGARMQTPSPYKDQLPICPKPLKSEALPRCKPECLTLKRILQTWPKCMVKSCTGIWSVCFSSLRPTAIILSIHGSVELLAGLAGQDTQKLSFECKVKDVKVPTHITKEAAGSSKCQSLSRPFEAIWYFEC